MGNCDFCFSCSGLMGDRFFSLSLMLFGGRIGDLCNGCFDGDFALLGVVLVGVIDPTCVLFELQHWISPHSQLGKIHRNVAKVSGAPEKTNHWLPA